jgi:serine/threonine protein kinase
MGATDPTRVKTIFAEAAEKAGEDRERFLREACAGDHPLRLEVEHLLAAAERAGDFFASPTQVATPLAAEPVREGPGARIGPYKLLQEIGEGGFGVVYMAQQTAPVKRKVALKVVKPGMDTRQVIARFEAERQALAMMDHPNIARVFDAGETANGRPYFVMELVKGIPITEYCDGANLSTRERIELFLPICHAVQHAHTKGVIHRDLKPSNILVTLHDGGAPVAKVIDFGIAKATTADLTDKTVFTAFRQFVGTPEYMSPEQAAMSGLDIDTRSDIYSLGVILYELLTGSTPIEGRRLRSAALEEMQRIIREDEPPRPSARIGRQTADAAVPAGPDADGRTDSRSRLDDIVRHRRTDSRSLYRMLHGDLDWIVMKALEKDRARRYETAAALAEDLQRSLRSEPVLARPPSVTYRARKFARRNRAVLAASGGVLAALMLTIAALAHAYLRARGEPGRLAERETVTRAELILSAMNSVRHYTTNHLRPKVESIGMPPGDFVRETVPAYSARKVFDDFRTSDKYSPFIYKEAAPDPSNPENLADAFEKGRIEAFRRDRAKLDDRGVIDIDGRRHYYIARPMVVDDITCLDCHGPPDKAPAGMVELYGSSGGYNWKTNDVVAAQMVYVPVAEASLGEPSQTPVILLSLAGVFVLGCVIAVAVLARG